MGDLTSDNDTKDTTTTDEQTSSQLTQSAPEDDSTAQEVQQGERTSGGYVSKGG